MLNNGIFISTMVGYYLALQKESGQGSIISGGSYDDTIVSIFSGPFNKNVKIITDIYPQ